MKKSEMRMVILSTVVVGSIGMGLVFGSDAGEPVTEKAPVVEIDENVTDVEEANEKEEEIEEEPAILTIENSEALNTALTTTLFDEDYEKFATDNDDVIIEFDGAIDMVGLLPGKMSRYEMFLRSGEYDPNTQTGPSFKVKDVGQYDPCITEFFASGKCVDGQAVKIQAKIDGYDGGSCAIELKLISVTER